MEIILFRIPVRIEATTTAVMIPTTIPKIVKPLLNLCEKIESIAIFRTSLGIDVESRMVNLLATEGTENTEEIEKKLPKKCHKLSVNSVAFLALR